ncbi:MAG: MerR family DNA-binding protein [Terriglobales bacterium]
MRHLEQDHAADGEAGCRHLTITELSRRSGVPAKTLRYWEAKHLLPRARRTHTGYRLFSAESERYIGFIRRAKTIGLTLGEMRQVLQLARAGRCPCPEVVRWSEARIQALEEQIRSLEALRRRLRRIQSACDADPATRCDGVCTLIEGLPEAQSWEKGGMPYVKAVACTQHVGARITGNGAARGGSSSQLLPARLPALPLQVGRKPQARAPRPGARA